MRARFFVEIVVLVCLTPYLITRMDVFYGCISFELDVRVACAYVAKYLVRYCLLNGVYADLPSRRFLYFFFFFRRYSYYGGP